MSTSAPLAACGTETSTPEVGVSSLLAALAALEAAVARTGAVPLDGVGASDLLVAAERLGVVQCQVDALRLRVVARVDEAGAVRSTGSLTTASWLQSQGQRPGAANRDVQLARKLAAHGELARALSDEG